MRRFLDRFLDEHASLDKDKADEFKSLFTRTIDFVTASLGENAFRPEKQLNTAVFDSVMIGLSERLKNKIAPDKKDAREAYDALLKDRAYRNAYLKATADEEQVRTRIQIAIDAFSRV
jgi:hypothetical protein